MVNTHCNPNWNIAKMMQHWLDRIDRVVDWLFESLPVYRVVGLAALVIGLSNIAEPLSGMGQIVMRDYHVSLGLHTLAMLILTLSGLVLLISRQAPAPLLYLPTVIYIVVTPIVIFVVALTQYNPGAVWFGVKTIGSLTLLGGYLLMRAIRRGDA